MTWVGMLLFSSFVPVEPAAVRVAEDGVAAAGGACMEPAIQSTQFCVCPMTSPVWCVSQLSPTLHRVLSCLAGASCHASPTELTITTNSRARPWC